MSSSNSPKTWRPNRIRQTIAVVTAGEWVQVFINYPSTNVNPVAYLPDRFMIHVLVIPMADDTVHHFERPTTFGGSATAQNRRREYHIDPGVAFQVPWRSEIYLIAGGDSAEDVVVNPVIARGYPPRANIEQLAVEYGITNEYGFVELTPQYVSQNTTPLVFPPPVVGVPQLVPATWIAIAPGGVPIQFPDGAQEISIVDSAGVPGSPVDLTVTAMGNALRTWFASGIRQSIGPWTQGNISTNGVAGTWIPTTNDVSKATIYSSFGN